MDGTFTGIACYEIGMPSDEIHELARQHPEAFANVASYCDGQLGETLQQVHREEQPTANSPNVAVSD